MGARCRRTRPGADRRPLRRAALGVLAAAAALSACGGEDPARPSATPQRPARVDLELRKAYPAGTDPYSTTATEDRVYAIGGEDPEVLTVDIASGDLVARRFYGEREVDPANNYLTTGLGSVWVMAGFAERVFRIDPASGAIQGAVKADGKQDIVVGADGRVYVDDFETERVQVIDPDSMRVVGSFPVPGAVGMAATDEDLLVVSLTQQKLYRFRFGETRPYAKVDLRQPYEHAGEGPGPERVVVAFGAAWVSDPVGNVVTRVPLAGGPNETIELGRGGFAWGMAADDTGVWVSTTGWLLHIDAETLEVDGEHRTLPPKLARKSFGAGDMIVADGALWVGEPDRARLAGYDIVNR